jgi:hypothetical protein
MVRERGLYHVNIATLHQDKLNHITPSTCNCAPCLKTQDASFRTDIHRLKKYSISSKKERKAAVYREVHEDLSTALTRRVGILASMNTGS